MKYSYLALPPTGGYESVQMFLFDVINCKTQKIVSLCDLLIQITILYMVHLLYIGHQIDVFHICSTPDLILCSLCYICNHESLYVLNPCAVIPLPLYCAGTVPVSQTACLERINVSQELTVPFLISGSDSYAIRCTQLG